MMSELRELPKDDPFWDWVKTLPEKHWAKYDLSACHLGWVASKKTENEITTCAWSYDEEDGYWSSACGVAFFFESDGDSLKKNDYNFCHKCGKIISE